MCLACCVPCTLFCLYLSVCPCRYVPCGLPSQFFGDDWANVPDVNVTDFEEKLAALSDPEKEALVMVMAKMGDLRQIVEEVDDLSDKAQWDLMQWQHMQQQQQGGGGADSGAVDEEGEGGAGFGKGGDASPDPYPGASGPMKSVLEVLQGGQTILVDTGREEEERRRRQQREREEEEALRREQKRRERERQHQAREQERQAEAGQRQWGDWGSRGGKAAESNGSDQQEDMDSRLERWAWGWVVGPTPQLCGCRFHPFESLIAALRKTVCFAVWYTNDIAL